MINCIVIDDEPLAREGMKILIEKINFLNLAGSFTLVVEADNYLASNSCDLIFLDIQMPGISGLDYLKLKKPGIPVILTTAFSEHAVEAFELNVLDYLVKPIKFERFYKAVSKVHDLFEQKNKESVNLISDIGSDFFYVRTDRKYVKILFQEVLFIESLKDYSTIYFKDQKIVIPMNLKSIESQLPSGLFYRISKFHVVNATKITSVDSDTIIINDHSLVLSQNYKEMFMKEVIERKVIKRPY